jgi:hypothetical protein
LRRGFSVPYEKQEKKRKTPKIMYSHLYVKVEAFFYVTSSARVSPEEKVFFSLFSVLTPDEGEEHNLFPYKLFSVKEKKVLTENTSSHKICTTKT